MFRIRLKLVFISILIYMFLPFSSTQAQTDFHDVDDDFWAKNEIEFLHEQEVIFGYPEGNFKPNLSINRTQAATMLVRALGLDTRNRPDPGFADISQNFHAYDIVATVAEEGLLTGSDGMFRPGETLSRAQMAVILQRAFELSGTWDREFTDIQNGFWAYDETQALAANRITTGYSADGTFRPSNPTTRAQFSVFLARQIDEAFKPADEDQVKESMLVTLYEEAKEGRLLGTNVKIGSNYYDVLREFGTPDSQSVNYMQYFSGYLVGLNPTGNVFLLHRYDDAGLTLNDLTRVFGPPDREEVQIGEMHTIYHANLYKLTFTRDFIGRDNYSNNVRSVFLQPRDPDESYYEIDKSTWQVYENQKFGFKVHFPITWSPNDWDDSGMALHEKRDMYIVAFARPVVEYDFEFPPTYYDTVTLNSGKQAYFHEGADDQFAGYHMILIEDGIEYHFSSEMALYFYEDNKHILDEIMLNFEVF
ncbi:S-layer homology domain-containing protein [Halalkalibacter alkaliphilus]|uniref:S-layer homology domain-containing protein n=1 Tax=Halalkalibacter alkaliphilus TaxID=2917993 RepID=A0A9X2CR44_9BACI|nr:S-layer homology domain-containing protein [Halalkalibacter alkaliphilus]MCL7746771.1 S-layer homology domain-containing protein [Halalkalibacter alkaliphilus]